MSVRKSYFAETVEAALAEAKRHMGAETLLVESRRTKPTERHLGCYEVIVEGDSSPHGVSVVHEETRKPSPPGPVRVSSSHELHEIRQELTGLRDLLARCAVRMAPALPVELLPLGARLAAADFPPAIVESVLYSALRATSEKGAGLSTAALHRAIYAEIGRRLSVDPEIGAPGAARKIVALAGPAGCGKTTTLVKLAVQIGLAKHIPTLILSADTYRVAASDQLRACAAILGVACEVVDTPGALVRALEEHRSKEIVLLDLPGMGPREPELMQEWAPAVARPEIDVQLVLPATMRGAELAQAARRFEPLRPARLVVTHLDETACCGGVLGLAMETQKPFSFLCAGQSVPEDLEPASLHALMRLIGVEPLAAAAAAAA